MPSVHGPVALTVTRARTNGAANVVADYRSGRAPTVGYEFRDFGMVQHDGTVFSRIEHVCQSERCVVGGGIPILCSAQQSVACQRWLCS